MFFIVSVSFTFVSDTKILKYLAVIFCCNTLPELTGQLKPVIPLDSVVPSNGLCCSESVYRCTMSLCTNHAWRNSNDWYINSLYVIFQFIEITSLPCGIAGGNFWFSILGENVDGVRNWFSAEKREQSLTYGVLSQ